MINRIRVVTLLVMVLGVFALLQLISGSLFFSSLHHSQKSFVVSNQLREQQGELTSTWDLMLQTRINLSRSAVRMMMDSSNQQSNAKVELLDSARKTLAQAATHYKKFKSMAPLPEMVATSRNIDEKYKREKGRQHRSADSNPEMVEKMAARYRHAAELHWSATLAEIERVKRLYQTKIKKSKKEVG